MCIAEDVIVASFIMFGEKKVGYSGCGIFYHVWGKKGWIF